MKYRNSSDIHDLELKINSHKVSAVKRMHGDLLGIPRGGSVERDVGASLSVYTK